MANPKKQHIEIPQIQSTDKIVDDSIVIQRQVSQRFTETKVPEHQQDDRSGGDADKDVQGEALIKHCWSGGKKMISICKQRFFILTKTVCTQQILNLIDLAHEIPGVKVAQKTWHKLLDDASTKEAVADDTANSNSMTHSTSQSWSKETKSSGFEESVGNSTNDPDSAKMPEMWIATVNPGRRSTVMELASETTVATSSLNTMGTKSKNTGKGKGKHVDVAETEQLQPSETVSTMSAIESGDADESTNMVKPGTEAWRLIHSRYAQNKRELISGSLLDDHADEHKQLPDESKKQTEDLAGMQAHHHEQQILLPRSLDEYRTKFRDEHNEITKTMTDLSIIQDQVELEEKADNEQQWRREMSMVAQDNDAKHGDVNSGQVAYQEDDNFMLQNENIPEYKEVHEQIQAYFSSTSAILDQKFRQELDRMAKDAYSETLRYINNL